MYRRGKNHKSLHLRRLNYSSMCLLCMELVKQFLQDSNSPLGNLDLLSQQVQLYCSRTQHHNPSNQLNKLILSKDCKSLKRKRTTHPGKLHHLLMEDSNDQLDTQLRFSNQQDRAIRASKLHNQQFIYQLLPYSQFCKDKELQVMFLSDSNFQHCILFLQDLELN